MLSYFPGYGGGGGGGGAGGYGGGIGGTSGAGGKHSETTKTGSGKDGKAGTSGQNNCGIGGSGGAGGLFTGNTLGGSAGSGTTVGSYGESQNKNYAFGGAGGGGNGGTGGYGDGSIIGNYYSTSNGGGGGGGGGYGGGILVIAANEIIYDANSKPYFIAVGQKGGMGGRYGSSSSSGSSNASSGSNGETGESGLIIVNTANAIPTFNYSVYSYGSNYPALVGGHGLVTGTATVLYNVDNFITSIQNIIGDSNSVKLKISPNPIENEFKLIGNSTTVTLHIFDIQGRQLLNRKVDGNESVSISLLPKGLYIVQESNI